MIKKQNIVENLNFLDVMEMKIDSKQDNNAPKFARYRKEEV
jgi:hypothetical protein